MKIHKQSQFHYRVYRAARKIPRGRVATYAQVARRAGFPHAARAAGNALNRNPLCAKSSLPPRGTFRRARGRICTRNAGEGKNAKKGRRGDKKWESEFEKIWMEKVKKMPQPSFRGCGLIISFTGYCSYFPLPVRWQIFQSGRWHSYIGFSFFEMAWDVRLFARYLNEQKLTATRV